MVIVLADTSKVHAGETRVRKLSAITTSPPPTGLRTSGATTTSSAAHGPLGWASGVGVGFGGLDLRRLLGALRQLDLGPLEVTDGVIDGGRLHRAGVRRRRVGAVARPDEQPADREHQQRRPCRAPSSRRTQ